MQVLREADGKRLAKRLRELNKMGLFAELSRREVRVVDGFMHERTYLKDEVIFDEGQRGDCAYLVDGGEVAIDDRTQLAVAGRHRGVGVAVEHGWFKEGHGEICWRAYHEGSRLAMAQHMPGTISDQTLVKLPAARNRPHDKNPKAPSPDGEPGAKSCLSLSFREPQATF